MQNPPPAVGNIPCKNLLLDKANDNPPDLPPPPLQLLANMVRNERTLREYAQPNLGMVQGIRLGKVLNSPKNPTQKANKGNTNDIHEEPSKVDDELELEEVAKLTIKREREQTKEPIIAKVPFPLRLKER
ncbi:hypothetical protein J1N35_013840 [Gossypium stocksii]|uniref:Uncharacterized protein n=1 Tax=Gossypium stocksii TaxID=47602 RepID=A0A9D4A8R4_9ROSI|nr:hypothetical protein J1N35_013840 [Gossypium stocksii]